jgi:hypothetical protein
MERTSRGPTNANLYNICSKLNWHRPQNLSFDKKDRSLGVQGMRFSQKGFFYFLDPHRHPPYLRPTISCYFCQLKHVHYPSISQNHYHPNLQIFPYHDQF